MLNGGVVEYEGHLHLHCDRQSHSLLEPEDNLLHQASDAQHFEPACTHICNKWPEDAYRYSQN